jgi:hypothetical protein
MRLLCDRLSLENGQASLFDVASGPSPGEAALQEALDRLRKELGIIRAKGFAHYFLLKQRGTSEMAGCGIIYRKSSQTKQCRQGEESGGYFTASHKKIAGYGTIFSANSFQTS